MIYILSYGGGINSSALFFHLIEADKPLDLVIFADTGEETPQTYEAVKRMKEECQRRNIEFVTVQSKYGRLINYYMEKKAVPSIMFRDCTSKFKIAPIRQYIRSRYGKKETFGFYIGIAFDEAQRARESDVKYITNIYPFIEDKINRKGNEEILAHYHFRAVKSGCSGCPYMGKKGFMLLKKQYPEEFKKWRTLEENGSRYPEITLNPQFKLKDLDEQTVLFDDTQEELTCWSNHCFI